MQDTVQVGRAKRRFRTLAASMLLVCLLTGAVRVGPVLSVASPSLRSAASSLPVPVIQVWQTSSALHYLQRTPDLLFSSVDGAGLPAIQVDPAQRFQRIAGFGGAFNERGWLALQSLSAADRQRVMRSLFDPVSGAGYSLARTPIGASDYALSAYSLDDTPGDTTLRHFSLTRDRRLLLPFITAARAVAPALSIWGSPWSAPAWMKTNNSMVKGGSLLTADEPVYARYLATYVQAYAAAGVPIAAISVQNEPSRSPGYPSMVMPPDQMARLVGHYLGPLFARLGIHTAIRVNEEPSRDLWSYSLRVLQDAAVRAYVAGSNIHGYHGSSTDLDRLHDAEPALDIWQTEDMNLDHPHYEYADAERWATEIASDLQNWVSGWDFWNLVTDQTGRSSWGWQQDAVVLVDTHRHTATLTPKYWAMAHFSLFIRPGAYRIAVSNVPSGLACTAALDPDGRTVLVVVNTVGHTAHFAIASEGRRAVVEVPGHGIATFVWR